MSSTPDGEFTSSPTQERGSGATEAETSEYPSYTFENDRVYISYCSMQGKRPTMEDAHQILPDLDKERVPGMTFIGVYDGHGGADVARFVAKNLHPILLERLVSEVEPELALRESFIALDKLLRDDTSIVADLMGTTAGVVLMSEKQVVAAGVGDTRVILARNRGAHCLTKDHKPGLQEERQRIESAGGIVIFGRTNGTLAISRAFGDFAMKTLEHNAAQQCVTAVPDTVSKEGHADDDFVLVACDGVWDVLSNEEAVQRVYEGLDSKKDVEEIAVSLARHCEISRDNVTVVIAVNKRNFPYLRDRDAFTPWDRKSMREEEQVPAAAADGDGVADSAASLAGAPPGVPADAVDATATAGPNAENAYAEGQDGVN